MTTFLFLACINNAHYRTPVRRWIAENRGLMRRMYGEVQEISLVRQKRQFSSSDEFLMPSDIDMGPMASTNMEDDELEDLFFDFKPLRGNSIQVIKPRI